VRALASPAKARAARRFFKTGPGEYGEGDRFLGVTMPELRALLPDTDALSESGVHALLHSEWHEERMLALLILVRRFQRAKDEPARASLVRLYLANTKWINNWDLVDCSAPQLLGAWLLERDPAPLRKLARSRSLWEQRIAIVATHAFIRDGSFELTLELCEKLLRHPHDLMHKACGWMLREVGKRDESVLRGFLDEHAAMMPRTMLRYAIERFAAGERRRFLDAIQRGDSEDTENR
jgi:3-methyladenine DNA glycosylase AlkD